MRGRMIRWGLPLVLVAVAGVGAAMAATAMQRTSGTVGTAKDSKFGTILVAANGHTLYRYTIDGKDVNRCSGVATCGKYWPALLVKSGAKPTAGAGVSAALVGTMKAAHGMRQVTYAGFPLYYFAGDKKAGQLNGQAFQSKWYVVNTKGALVKQPVSSGGGGTSSSGGGTSTGGAWG